MISSAIAFAEEGSAGAPPIDVVPNLRHSTSIDAIAFSADGLHIVTATTDVRLWDAKTGRLLRTFLGHKDSVNSVAFSPDGKRIASASDDKSVKIWDVASGKLLKDVAGLDIVVKAVAFSPDGDHIFFGGFWENQAKLLEWDLTAGQQVRLFAAAGGPWQIAVSPSGDQLLSSDAKDVKLLDRASGKLLHRFPVINAKSFSVSKNGQQVLISDGATIKIFEATGRQLRSLQAAKDVVFAGFSPDEKQIIAASEDFTVRIWDASSGKLQQSFKAHEAKTDFTLETAVLSPDGAQILCAGRDNSLNLWDMNSGRMLRSVGLESNFLRDFAFSPKEKTVVVGGDDKAVRLWDIDSGKLLNEFRGHADAVKSIGFSPDGERVLSADDSAAVRIWKTATGETLKQFKLSSGSRDAAFSPNGKLIFDNNGKLWDADSGKLLRTLSPDFGTGAFSPDSSRLAVDFGSPANTIKIFDSASGKSLTTIKQPDEGIPSVQFAPDGTTLLTANGASMALWELRTGKLLRSFPVGGGGVRVVAFSPDGTMALSTNDANEIKLFEVSTGNLLWTVRSWHMFGQIAFSRDGRQIIVVNDNALEIRDMRSGALLVTLISGAGGEWLAMTPEGFFVAAEKGAQAVSVVRGLDVWSVDQFYQSLYRPDLVREKLAGDPRGLVRTAAARLDLNRLIASGRPPQVHMSLPGRGLGTSSPNGTNVSVEAEITDAGGGIGRVEWRVNGVTVGVERPAARAGAPVRLARNLVLEAGDNSIEIVAYNGADLVASAPESLSVAAQVASPAASPQPSQPNAAPAVATSGAKPRLFALVAGVNEYTDKRIRLSYAVPDAKEVARSLKEAGGGLYQSVEVKLMADAEVTRDRLDKAFTEMAAKVQPSDVFVLYLAGHGKTVDGRYYFIPQDFAVDGDFTDANINAAVVKKGVTQDQLQRWFAEVPARKSLILFDTCESGTLTGDAAETQQLEKGAANDRLAQATGRSIITASGGSQSALEGYHGHGLFTYELLDAIGRADADGTGTVEVTELAAFVYAQVSELSQKVFNQRQAPQMKITANYPFAKQTRILQDEVAPVAEARPDYQVSQAAQLQIKPGLGETVVRSLSSKTAVTVLESKNGWSLVASGGRPLGYVATHDLIPVH